jgi:hypothetical protein
MMVIICIPPGTADDGGWQQKVRSAEHEAGNHNKTASRSEPSQYLLLYRDVLSSILNKDVLVAMDKMAWLACCNGLLDSFQDCTRTHASAENDCVLLSHG